MISLDLCCTKQWLDVTTAIMIMIHNIVPPVTYGIILVGPPGLFSPRQPGKRNISLWKTGDQNTDPCYQDRSLCATRMGEMGGSLALLSTCLGSENRQG